jgi:putative two-component system response regulator
MAPAKEPTGHSVLVVDDDPHVALLLERLVESEGHSVRRACDGWEALELVRQCPPDLVLLDLDMPHLGGFEVCRRLKQDPALRLMPIVIITAQSDAEARLRAWELGADDFLHKPFSAVDVAARCRSLLRVKSLVDELDGAQSVMFALARAIEAKSRYTQGHSERVTSYAVSLARRLGLGEADCDLLRRGGLLHDIGKIAIPDAILNKPGELTAEECEIVKRHPDEGVRIVESLRSVRDTVPQIRWHHERLDGRGYPDGLFGTAIPLLARLLAVADVYDALASERPYRSALPFGRCLEVLGADAAGGGLDPELVAVFREPPAVPLEITDHPEVEHDERRCNGLPKISECQMTHER